MAVHRPGCPTSVREVAGAMGTSTSQAWELLKVAEDLRLVRLQDGPVRGFYPADTPRVCGACGQAVAS